MFFVGNALAQNVSLRGQIVADETGENLAFASVVVYENDSIYKAGATTNQQGEFFINNLDETLYRIRISFVGYKTVEIEQQLTADTNLGKIALATDAVQLDDAVVTMTLPVIEHKVDKTVVNVANSVTADGNKAIDMLRNSPGVTVDSEGNVQLNGKAVQVWIDGRPSQLSGKDLESYLNGIEATALEKIELIANPSAKYDAEGSGGIIDLKMKRNRLGGFNGSADVSHRGMIYNKKYYHTNSISLNLNYRSRISNTFFTYSPHYQTGFSSMNASFSTAANQNWLQRSSAFSAYNYSGHSLRAGTDFFIDKKNTLGFVVNANFSNSESNQNPQQTFNQTFVNDTLIEASNTLIVAPEESANVSVNLNYTTVFDEAKSSELTLNADYLHWTSQDSSYNDNRYSRADGTMAYAPQIFSQNMRQSIDVYSFKADFQHTFIEKLMFESGVKASVSQTRNNFLRENFDGEQWQKDAVYSADFRYTEQIYALYASLAAQLGKKWSVKGGVRGEYTYSIGDWVSKNETTYRNYFDVFPTVYASYLLSEKYNFSLAYNIRINRPSYYLLKPFRTYIDESTAVEGNPQLLPMKTHNLTFSSSLIRYFNIGATYSHTDNHITQVLKIEGDEKVYYRENFGVKDDIYLNLSCSEFPLVKNLLTATLFANLGYSESTDKMKMKNGSFTANFYGNMTMILPRNWKIEASGWGYTGGTDGYFRTGGVGSLNLGVRKSWLDNRLRLSFKFIDILNTCNQRVTYKQNGVVSDFENRWMTPSFGVSLSYNFGKATQTPRCRVSELEEASRLGGDSGVGK